MEVLAEVCYVLEGVYQVTREDIACNFRKLVNDVSILNVDILLRGLEIFDKSPKLDFVDCLFQWGKILFDGLVDQNITVGQIKNLLL